MTFWPGKGCLVLKCVALSIFIVLANPVSRPFERFELLMFYHDGYTGVLLFSGIWLVSLVGLLAIAFHPHWIVRMIFGALIIASSFVGLSYGLVADFEINYDSLAIMLEASDFAGAAASFYTRQILVAACVVLLGAWGIVYPLRRPLRAWPWNWFNAKWAHLTMLGLIVTPFLVILGIAILRGGYGTNGLPEQYKSASLFAMICLSELTSENVEREVVALPLSSKVTDFGGSKGAPHVVLIVDESVRADFLDLNRMRGITPRLLLARDFIANFGTAVAATNTSAGSNLVLRTGATPVDFQQTLVANPHIWDYAHKAGYKTMYIEAQVEPNRLNNRMDSEEKSKIDDFVYAKGNYGYEKDLDVSATVREVCLREEPYFIYVVKSGVHFPYNDSYPVNEAIFKPHLTRNYGIKEKRLMVNSYKNAIRWTIDGFFEALFTNGGPNNAVVLYTSDHGQSLLDNSSKMGHGSVTNPSPYEALVPLFVFTQNETWKARFEKSAIRNHGRASHFNIYPTLLHIFGYNAESITSKHGAGLLDANLGIQKFISGVVTEERRFSYGDRNTLSWNDVPQTLTRFGLSKD